MNFADCVADLFHDRTEAEPDRVLLAFEGAELSRAEVFDRACRFANLPGAGDRRRIGVLADGVGDAVAAFLGCALSGAVYVGLDPQRKGPDLTADLAAASVDLLIVEPKYAPSLDDDTLEAYVLRERFLVIDSEAPAGLLEPQESLEAALTVSGATDPQLSPGPDEVAAVTFTSGPFARPIEWTNRRLLEESAKAVGSLKLERDDTGWCGVPPSRIVSIAWGLLPALHSGGSLVRGRQQSASACVGDIVSQGCSWLSYEGPMLSDLVALGRGLGPLRAVIGTGADESTVYDFAGMSGCFVADRPALQK